MKNKSTNVTAQAELARINAEIEALHQKRVGLASPLKTQYASLRNELTGIANQIRELDPTWRPDPLKPKAENRIRELIQANEGPMTEAEIIAGLKDTYSKWKVKQALKKGFSADANGKYSVKA